MSAKAESWIKPGILPLVLVGLWHFGSMQGSSWAYAFVPLYDISASFLEMVGSGDLTLHLWASVSTTFAGLLFGSIAGFLLGAVMTLSRTAEALLGPLFHAMRQVPTLGYIPLIALWFGTGELAIILLVSLSVFEVIALNTYEGLSSVEKRFLELGDALVFTTRQRFVRILLPAAFPSILTGLLQAVSFAWLATVGAELLFTVGPGLGAVMERAQIQLRMDRVIVCLVCIGALGLLMNNLCVKFGRRILRWRQAR